MGIKFLTATATVALMAIAQPAFAQLSSKAVPDAGAPQGATERQPSGDGTQQTPQTNEGTLDSKFGSLNREPRFRLAYEYETGSDAGDRDERRPTRMKRDRDSEQSEYDSDEERSGQQNDREERSNQQDQHEKRSGKQEDREKGSSQQEEREERSGKQKDREERSGQQEEREERSGKQKDREERSGQQEEREERSGKQKDREERSGQQEEREKRFDQKKDREERSGLRHEEPSGKERHKHVQLDESKRRTLRERIVSVHPQRLDRGAFDARVGVAIPRSITLHDLPSNVVEVVPQYRAFKFVLIGDSIVIIDPHTYEIVAIIPA